MKRLTIIAALLTVAIIARADEAKPVTYRLNPEASKAFVAIDAAENQLRQQYATLEAQRAALLIGAGVPEGSRICTLDKETVVCAKPAPTPTK
jgi:hypothetical protein